MKKHILLSIKPNILKRIIDGTKLIEFRKKFPNLNENKNISNKIIIYQSKPKMEIFGSFESKKYICSNFDNMMAELKLNEFELERISNYFVSKESCHAIVISNIKIYEHPIGLKELRQINNKFVPGQSYRYLENGCDILKHIINKNKEI